jgi:hypothetical protein
MWTPIDYVLKVRVKAVTLAAFSQMMGFGFDVSLIRVLAAALLRFS